NKEIDEELQHDRKRIKEEVKLLLLGMLIYQLPHCILSRLFLCMCYIGPGESGKSTIFKQMKIISLNGGFTREERMEYRMVVFGNCITQMKVIVNAAAKLSIDMGSDENKVC